MGEVSNETIYSALLGMKETLGQVKAGVASNSEHTIAVSKKADAIRAEFLVALTDHAKKDETHFADTDAHGRGSQTKLLVQMGGMVVGMVAVAEGLTHLFKVVAH